MTLPVSIVIPTYNRARLIGKAVETALGQSHSDVTVLVVDDGSADETRQALARFRDHDRFAYVRLSRNLGTAQAKNTGIVLSGRRAITFHDSDDIPHRDKVLRQARVMANDKIEANPVLNWNIASREPDTLITLGAVLTHHEILLPDGERVEIRRTLSLVDDFFPNLQMAAGVPGDWTHVNSGLFHADVFARLGGFSDSTEEDREFRNRLIMAGEVIWVIPEILLTKIETEGSMTLGAATSYDSKRRVADRRRIWAAAERWMKEKSVDPVPIELGRDPIDEIWNPHLCQPSRAMMSAATRSAVQGALSGQIGQVA